MLNLPTSSTGYSLFDYKEPLSALFKPSNAYMKSAHRSFGLMPTSNSGGATPMPDWTSSLTPAWDPLSRTPRYSQFLIPISVY